MLKIIVAALLMSTVAASAQFQPRPGTTGSPQIYAPDGQYLGNLNSNRYDPNSVSNPYGQYGSRYSPNSINNPYSQYGSPYSPNSVRNPYAH